MLILQRFIGGGTASIVPLFFGLMSGPGTTYGQFTSGVNLVEVYATVMDREGGLVTGLTAADFRVSEDGAGQSITAFSAGQVPLAVALGIDRSFSMAAGGNRLAVARSAARAFIGALQPGDQVMVLAIGSETEVVAPLTTNHAAALDAITRLDAWGTTPLYDATLAAIDAVQPARGRRALVLLSDGADRYSETSATALVDQARRRDVLAYPVAIGESRPPVFAELAAATGGRSFFVREPRELATTLTTIARELRAQYLLGYAPARRGTGDLAWHAIEVTMNRPDLRVRARDGYFAR